MSAKFSPTYQDFHKDIERYLTSIGKREKTNDGFIVFRGYEDALHHMFEVYMAEGALEPLVKHFRRENWEWQYNTFLHRLTEALKSNGDWENLKVLWEQGVLRKRRKHYNDAWKIEKDKPGTLKPKSFQKIKELLLETILDITQLANGLGSFEDVEIYEKMKRKLDEGKRV